MAKSVYAKNIKRTIFGSLGRYIAILAIIAIGVGFFVGVKNTKASMILTCDEYVNEFDLYDFKLISTYGFTEDDVEALSRVDEVSAAEGAVYADFFSEDRNNQSVIIRAHSVTDNVNRVDLAAGRMPEKANECVADDFYFSEDDIGLKLKVTDKNEKGQKAALKFKEYEIVGIAKSPYYMLKRERGTTSIGDGKIAAFIYMPVKGFTAEYFTEIFITCKSQGYVYSEEYEENIDTAKGPITAAAEKQADIRYNDIVGEAQAEIDDGRKELEEGKAEFKSKKTSAENELKNAKNSLDSSKKELASGKKELAKNKSTLKQQRAEAVSGLNAAKAALAQAEASGDEQLITTYTAAVQQAEAGIAQIDAGMAQIEAAEKELNNGEAQLASGYEAYYENKAKAEREFAKAERELDDAEKELDEAEEELADLEPAEVFVQTRDDNPGFSSFDGNSDIVDSIAKVFPVFFFLIAALVCSTTMSRMVEEERTQIGALRALGYTNGRIMKKYMIYSGSAAFIGCIIGYFAGSKFFPLAIWIAYGMMFGFAPLEYYFNWSLALISLIVSLICSMGTTYFACKGQLASMPAEILRPKAPKAGKRIILERIGFIWNRLKFLHKVTARNILRYKKRMIMMIIGIGGCAALVLAGFGMDDSVAGISDHQYGNIEKHDVVVAFSDELDKKEQKEFKEKYRDDLKNTAVLQQSTVTLKSGEVSKTSTLIVTDDENISNAIVMKESMSDEETIPYPETGEAVVNNKMAEMLGVEVGDEIIVEYDDTHHDTLKISGIYRNYVNSYLFINAETYESVTVNDYEPSIMYLTMAEGSDVHQVADKISDSEDIVAISVNEDVKVGIDEMMQSLNYIIILVILCAGALAFIVLFNLSNINLTERVREIATIEVLGFYPRETGAYVFRENLILVILGIIAGLPTGMALHRFIMKQIQVDMVSFENVIEPLSYIYTVITVLVFTFIVDRVMRLKLKKINMAEALKSIE